MSIRKGSLSYWVAKVRVLLAKNQHLFFALGDDYYTVVKHRRTLGKPLGFLLACSTSIRFLGSL